MDVCRAIMESSKWWIKALGHRSGFAALVTVASLVLLACTSAAPTPSITPSPTQAPTVTPVPTATPLAPTVTPFPTPVNQEAPTPTAVPPPTPLPLPTTARPPTPVPLPTTEPSPTPVPPTPILILQLPNVADTVERVRPAVVSIVAEIVTSGFFGPRSGFGTGTGIIFDSQGLVLTNNHVISTSENITVTLDDGTQMQAEVVGADRLSDLAVLRLPSGDYPHLPMDSDIRLRVGEWVIAIGNALALPGGPTVTVGVVSALGRSFETSPGVTLYDLIQTDTVINPGNSGGPLINLEGSLIGINTAVQRISASGTVVEGIGFAINVDTAAQVAQQLVELGRVRWAWMGVILADLLPEVAAEVGLPIREGAIIHSIVIDGPAYQAGIRPGDIVMSADSKKVATVSDLIRLLKQEFQAGQKIDVELFRDGEFATVNMVLGERPAQ